MSKHFTLLNETRLVFYKYVEKINNSKDEMNHFKNKFKHHFENEILALGDYVNIHRDFFKNITKYFIYLVVI